MIAIEAKYFELCKYTVTYVGLNFLQKSSAVAGGGATHVDPTYVSPGDAWFDGSAVLYCARIARIGAFESGGSLPLRQNFAWKGSAPIRTNHFWRGQ